MNRLKGRKALITGGGAGIGAETGLVFCREGAAVLLVDMSVEAVDETVRRIRQECPGAHVEGFAANVSDADQAMQAVALCSEKFGGLDILVNNAAMRNHAAVIDASLEEWDSMLKVNLVGVANYCKAALPSLRQSGNASIVNVSSAHAVVGRKGMGIYDSTKAAQLALTRTLAFEEATYGVRVNAICPGSTLTTFQRVRAVARGQTEEELKSARAGNSLLGRWGTPEEIAWPIVWLASNEGSFITGAVLMVDGGLSAM